MANNMVTLTGKIPGGAYAQAIFTPSRWETDRTNKALFPPVPQTVILDGNGSFSISLLATDNASVQPSGWTWTIEVIGVQGVIAGFSFSFPLPFASGATQDISAYAPIT